MLNKMLTLEILSVVFNLVFIVLLTKEKRLCWIFGVLGSISGALLFYLQNYYSETLLYLFYAVLGAYGWLLWNQKAKELAIKKLKRFWHWIIILGGLMATMLLGFIMSNLKADKPYYDAFSTVFGVMATFLELHKYLSGWLYWIGLNLFSIWLYAVKDLWVYAALMIVYTALSVFGYWKWSQRLAVK